MQRNFDKQMNKLRTRIIKMCSLVDEQVDFAIRAVEEGDSGVGNIVIERDRKVDDYDLKIDRICQKIFALNHPVAMDLRLIMSALTINNHLERIGDLAVSIVRLAQRLEGKPTFFQRSRFSEMANIVREMLRDAIDAFIEMDARLAEKVIETDSKLDQLNYENHDSLITVMKEDSAHIEQGVTLLVMCRQLERLGDHATNMAEDIYFIVEAQMIKHNYEKYLFSDDDNDDDD